MAKKYQSSCGEAAGLAGPAAGATPLEERWVRGRETRGFPPAIAHVDADSFFASVLVRLHPELRGKPLLALGMGGGCVIAASYEAKRRGVKTGMRLADARKLVPDAVAMPSDFRETALASHAIEDVLRGHCPVVEQMSVDEWFMDLTSLAGGIPKDLERHSRALQAEILQTTALSVSIGVAPSKTLAKMASEYRKPGGVTIVTIDSSDPPPLSTLHFSLSTFLSDRPAAAIPGIGPRRTIVTDVHGWRTAADFVAADPDVIRRLFGKPGTELQRELLGERVYPVTEDVRPPQSISRCRTFRATTDTNLARAHLLKHVEYCTEKMRRWNLGCTEVAVWLRTVDGGHLSTHRRLGRVVATAEAIMTAALAGLDSLLWKNQRFNQIGLALVGLRTAGNIQQSLFENPKQTETGESLQKAMDSLHKKFGRDSLTHGAALSVRSGTAKNLDLPFVE